MTQGGPAFLTSDITRWECAPHKNTNKMSWRAGGGGSWQMFRRAPRLPGLRHRLYPGGEGTATARGAWGWGGARPLPQPWGR